ncbi:Uncharacterized protein OBRU01_13486 [Operophtera brumata]|uniref:Uncharacterized protein n=1 Tax=Operophtera brumata TaxID=104452 RepID=A0A0L7KX19_OPEBR|nr:Uncharacterized protein OBRU01_13486 [Operophtera brumata]
MFTLHGLLVTDAMYGSDTAKRTANFYNHKMPSSDEDFESADEGHSTVDRKERKKRLSSSNYSDNALESHQEFKTPIKTASKTSEAKETRSSKPDGDPGLAKKRAMLGLDSGDKPILSQVLREAKAKADEEDQLREVKREAKEIHYVTLFDDFEEMLSRQTSMRIEERIRAADPDKRQDMKETLQQVAGLVHLEALEMLSRQISMRIEEGIRAADTEKRQDMKETLQQVAGLVHLEALEMLSRQTSMRIEERVRAADPDKRQDMKETLQQVAGLVHLEALEMLSRQTSMRIEERVRAADPDKRQDMKETLQQVAGLVHLEALEMLSRQTSMRIEERVRAADPDKRQDMKETLQQVAEILEWLDLSLSPELTDKAVYKQCVAALAQATALSVQTYHKTGELLLTKQRRMTVVLTKHISSLATLFTEKLNSLPLALSTIGIVDLHIYLVFHASTIFLKEEQMENLFSQTYCQYPEV